jgi:hypothetical protein
MMFKQMHPSMMNLRPYTDSDREARARHFADCPETWTVVRRATPRGGRPDFALLSVDGYERNVYKTKREAEAARTGIEATRWWDETYYYMRRDLANDEELNDAEFVELDRMTTPRSR